MRLSIIIPVYNEEKTIQEIIEKIQHIVIKDVVKEIIVVNDGSTDGTGAILSDVVKKKKDILYVQHKKNIGKGRAIQSGIQKASGDYIIIQDADLEYDPVYIPKLLRPILSKKSNVVYGTRLNRLPNLKQEERTFLFMIHYLGNRFLSFLVSVCYHTWLTDIETGYKVIPIQFTKKVKFVSSGFDIEAELTVKLLKNGYTITEVPIRTRPRGYNEGKKLQTIPEGIKAIKMIIKHVFIF